MESRDARRTFDVLPLVEPVQDGQANEVIGVGDRRDCTAANSLGATCFRRRTCDSCAGYAGDNRQRQNVTAFEVSNLVDFVFGDMAACAEVEENLQRATHVTTGKTGHDLANEPVMRVERFENTGEVSGLIGGRVGDANSVEPVRYRLCAVSDRDIISSSASRTRACSTSINGGGSIRNTRLLRAVSSGGS